MSILGATTAGAATGPESENRSANDLESLLARINELASNDETLGTLPAAANRDYETGADGEGSLEPADGRTSAAASENTEWIPEEPETLEDAKLTDGQIEHLALKSLNALGDVSGRAIAEQHALPFRLVEPELQNMKLAQLVAFRGAAPMNDYVYQLTDLGRERARKLTEQCAYFGAAPVTLDVYSQSVRRQTLTSVHPTEPDLHRAFKDLLINKRMLKRLGPAINSGRGLFLYGQPGNGKTSIAERVTSAFGDCVWIPKAIVVDGEIMRMYDPALHEAAPAESRRGPLEATSVDRRWVRVRRPTIVVGGELTMDALEVSPGTSPNVSEAPLQMKSNCGTLVIDDFGRQRMTTDVLLNRWIVPLEKRYDFLRMINGKKIQVPFDQLIIFSTNLEPRDLVDDAFLRRIPYKIEVVDPSEDEFRQLFKIMSAQLDIRFDPSALDYLIDKHYRAASRPFRCCQPRDLLLQVVNYSKYLDTTPEMSPEYLDYAVENYFAIM